LCYDYHAFRIPDLAHTYKVQEGYTGIGIRMVPSVYCRYVLSKSSIQYTLKRKLIVRGVRNTQKVTLANA